MKWNCSAAEGRCALITPQRDKSAEPPHLFGLVNSLTPRKQTPIQFNPRFHCRGIEWICFVCSLGLPRCPWAAWGGVRFLHSIALLSFLPFIHKFMNSRKWDCFHSIADSSLTNQLKKNNQTNPIKNSILSFFLSSFHYPFLHRTVIILFYFFFSSTSTSQMKSKETKWSNEKNLNCGVCFLRLIGLCCWAVLPRGPGPRPPSLSVPLKLRSKWLWGCKPRQQANNTNSINL